jgi:hypothetical protein
LVREHGDQLYISTVTVAEIEARAVKLGATAKAQRLDQCVILRRVG